MRQDAHGFSLVELMIVVAIIGILAAVATPRYIDSVTRARVSEGLLLLSPVKTAVVEYHAVRGHLPTATNWLALLKELGLPVSTASGAASGAYVERIWWNSTAQQIRVRFGVFPIDAKRLTLTANVSGSRITWRCGVPAGEHGIAQRYLPATCRR